MTWRRALGAVVAALLLLYIAAVLLERSTPSGVELEVRRARIAAPEEPPNRRVPDPPVSETPAEPPVWVAELEQLLTKLARICPTGGPIHVVCEGPVCVVKGERISPMDAVRHMAAHPAQTVTDLTVRSMGLSSECETLAASYYERVRVLNLRPPGPRCDMVTAPNADSEPYRDRALAICDELAARLPSREP